MVWGQEDAKKLCNLCSSLSKLTLFIIANLCFKYVHENSSTSLVCEYIFFTLIHLIYQAHTIEFTQWKGIALWSNEEIKRMKQQTSKPTIIVYFFNLFIGFPQIYLGYDSQNHSGNAMELLDSISNLEIKTSLLFIIVGSILISIETTNLLPLRHSI